MNFERGPFLRFADPNRVMRGLDFFQPFGNGTAVDGHYPIRVWSGHGPTFLAVMPTERRDVILRAGFDFIRHHVLMGVLMDAPNDDILDARIAEVTSSCAAYVSTGLKCIINLNPTTNPPLSIYNDHSCLSGPGGASSAIWQRYVHCAARLAAAIDVLNASGGIAMELFNEPPHPSSIIGARWPVYVAGLFKACRSLAPRTTLLVSGTGYASIEGTLLGIGSLQGGAAELDLGAFDLNTMIVFHGYDGAETFTLQNSSGTTYEQNGPLYYPTSLQPGGKAQAKTDLLNNLNAALASGSITRQQYNERKYQFYDSNRGDSYNIWFDKLGNNEAQAARLTHLIKKMDTAGWSRRSIGDSEVGVTWAHPHSAPQESARNFIRARYDRLNNAGCGLICVHTGGGKDQNLMGSNGICVQSGIAPYEFAPWLLDALRML